MSKRSHGKRYDKEQSKLNIKKVIAVIVAMAVMFMFVVGIKTLLTQNTSVIATTSYYPVYTNNKWGVINEKGEIIIQPQYEEMITIPDSKTDIFLCTYDVDYINNTYKTKVIDSENKEKFTSYDLIEVIENFDDNNNLWYEESVLRVKKGTLYGLINYSGKEILPVEYTSIEALSGVKNSLVIKKEDKVGLCDNTGKIIIKPEFNEIRPIEDNYKNGYVVVDSNNKFGLIDFTGASILEPTYEEIKPVASSSIFIVKENGVLKAINKNKETVIENKFDDVKEINNQNIVFETNGKFGVINANEEIKIQPEYEDLKYIFNNYYIAKNAGQYGIINIENEIILPLEYSNISYIEDSRLIETVKGEVYEYYDSSIEQVEGKKATKTNTQVENIGKWHLAEEMNLYYYSDEQ